MIRTLSLGQINQLKQCGQHAPRDKRTCRQRNGTTKCDIVRTDLQFSELLAKLPGILVDGADAIVGQSELLQRRQAVKPGFRYRCDVVVIQLTVESTLQGEM